MRKTIGFVLRFLVFVVGLGAVGAMLVVGVMYLQGQRQGSISIGGGDIGPGQAAQGPADAVTNFLRGIYLQINAGQINIPNSGDSTVVPFTIEPGETAPGIASRLQQLGLIGDTGLFLAFLRYNGADASLEAGDYELRHNMSMREIAETLQHGRMEDLTVTIPEGLRAEQVAELLAAQNVMDGSLFLAAVRQGVAIDHPLLADRPAGMSFEGYLFPETYRLPARAKPEDVLIRMLNTMEQRLPIAWQGMAQAQGLTFYQVLTLASIVEREAVVPDERPTIASGYLNRLKSGMRLEADPTVQYAMGYQPQTKQWWKTPVTIEEYEGINSPYNTYLYPGLPPGPICSPGERAIIAVLQPAQTNYKFFIARGDGSHIFAETFEEHQRNYQQYQGG